MKYLSRGLTVGLFTAVGWLCADIAPGDPGWPQSYPAWWYKSTDPAGGIIDATQPVLNQDNAAPLVLGQLKHMATEARDELDEQLSAVGGAGLAIDMLVNSFTVSDPANFSPATIGQLKAVSSVFYDRFAEVGFGPGSPGWPTGMELVDTTGATDNSPLYPWLEDQTNGNLALANLGQAKFIFSWDLSSWDLSNQTPIVFAGQDQEVFLPPGTVTLQGNATDPDGSPQPITVLWTQVSGTGTAIFSSADSVQTEVSFDTIGTYTLRLTANDGVSVGSDEVVILVRPFDDGPGTGDDTGADDGPEMGFEDSDEDGLTNVQEEVYLTDPDLSDTDGDGVDDGEDGWPHDPNLSPLRASESYALIDLSSYLPMGSEPHGLYKLDIDDEGYILLNGDSVAVYQLGNSEAVYPLIFNRTLTDEDLAGIDDYTSDNGCLISFGSPATVRMNRDGYVHFLFEGSADLYCSENRLAEGFGEQLNKKWNARTGEVSEMFDFSGLDYALGTVDWFGMMGEYGSEGLLTFYFGDDIGVHESYGGQVIVSDVEANAYDGSKLFGRNGIRSTIYSATALPVSEGGDPFIAGSDFGSVALDYQGIGSILSTESVGNLRLTSVGENDILYTSSGHYSLDAGSTFHPVQVVEGGQLVSHSFGEASDQLIIPIFGTGDIIINQRKVSVADLLEDQATDWSDFELRDINSSGMIVGTALNEGVKKVFALLKVDLEIEDEHFTDNIMDTSETDDDLEQFIMARESTINPDPFEITIRPSDTLAGISKTRYRLVSPNETGGVDETDGPFTAEVTGLAVNYHNDEPAELHVGIDTNNNNELDESEYLKTVSIHPLYWNVTGADSEQSLGLLQTVPSDVLLLEASGELASYLYDNQFKTIITGPVDGLELIVRYTSTEDTDDWFEETIGSIAPEGSKVADLEQVFYEFPGSEGGSGITEEVLLSSGVRMIYSEPTAGGTRKPINETIWNQLWSDYSYGVVHNDDVSLEIKRAERPNIYKKVLEIPLLGGVIKKEGQALRQFYRVLEDRHGTGLGNTSPSDTTITVKEYDAFYKKLIDGARAAGSAQYLSIVGVEEVGGFKGLAMSGDNMEWWVRGTQRTGYGQTGADGFPADYKVLDYQEFSSKSFIQERIDKYLIGWPVKNSNAGTTILESILSDSRFNIANRDTEFAYTERAVQINVNDYQNLSDMQDLARALGTFGIRAVNSDTLSSQSISGGTWEIEQLPSGIDFMLRIKVKLEVFDTYDWEVDSAFDIPVPDGESPAELSVPDNWQLYYETLSGNYLGGEAKPFEMGTKYEWSIIQVDVPLVYTGGNLQLATPVENE
ncbi:MAG: hypothetical protein AAGH40_12920 [Verrucomicrobiota bacterium]